jgi:hypothetical protein
MGLGFTKRLTKKSIRNHFGGEVWPALKADNLAAIFEPIFYTMLDP